MSGIRYNEMVRDRIFDGVGDPLDNPADKDVGGFLDELKNALFDQQHRAPKKDEEPPKLKDIQGVQIKEQDGNTIIRIQTKDGDFIKIDRNSEPELFEEFRRVADNFLGIKKSEKEGYKRAGGDEPLPAFSDIDVSSKDELGPNIIRYHFHGGAKFVVSKEDNPELFAHLKKIQGLKEDQRAHDLIQKFHDEGFDLAGEEFSPPKINDYKYIQKPKDDVVGVIAYELRDGRKIVVSEDLTPDLYRKVFQDQETFKIVADQEKEGYKFVGDNFYPHEADITRFGWPEELGHGLIRFETRNGGKYLVSKEVNPSLYDRIANRRDDLRTSETGDLRQRNDISDLDSLDILQKHTTEKDKDGKPLSVSELATKNFIEELRKGVADGTYGKDSPEAKLLLALEAKAALKNGRYVTGYEERKEGIGTFRKFNDDPTHVNGADHEDIIDGAKVDKMIAELFQNENISKKYDQKIQDAIGKVENKDQLVDQLVDMLSGDGLPKFLKYIQDLKAEGMTDFAQSEINKAIKSLALLDEKKAAKAAADLQKASLTVDLNDLVADPDRIKHEFKEQALKDLFGLLKGLIKADVLDVPRRMQETFEKFINEMLGDKKKSGDLIKVLEELQKKIADGKPLTGTDIDNALKNSYTSVADRGEVGKLLDFLNNKGVLSSLGGGVSLFSALYQMFGKNGKLGDEPLERLSIARDFISFVGSGQHFIKLGDSIFSKVGQGVGDMLGLGKSLPEIWGNDGMWGKDLNKAKPQNWDMLTDIGEVVDDKLKKLGVNKPPGVNDDIYDGIARLFGDDVETGSGGKVPDTVAKRVAGSVIKLLGGVGDTFSGIADIVLGAFTIKKGVDNGSALEKTAGSLQLLSGVFGAAGGGIGLATMLGIGTIAGPLSGPLFLIGVLFAGIAALVGYFVDHEKRQKATDKEGQWYKELANLGLMQADWGDKLEYIRYALHRYGQRDAPEDVSMFDFQSKEWKHFQETQPRGGSSSNRLNEWKHIEWEGDGKNNVSKYDDEPASWGS